MKVKFVYFVVTALAISLLVHEKYYKKQTIYIGFEDIEGYNYSYKKDSLGVDNTIVIKQEGKFSYISWKLDVDRDDIQKFDRSFTEKFDRYLSIGL